MCNDQVNIISQEDFSCIGNVAKHCDNEKLCIAIGLSETFDMEALFCGFWQDILAIDIELKTYDTAYQLYLVELDECEADPECTTPPVAPTEPTDYDLKNQLICGGSYESCNGKTRFFKGVRFMFVNYAYAKYVIINPYSDTPNGLVNKTNDFSVQVPLKERQSLSDMYRSMGYETFKGVQNFLCKNRTAFADFDSRECKGCGCGGNCDEKTKAKGYGMKSSVISKSIPNTHYHGRLRKD